jgi:hypothetical protein
MAKKTSASSKTTAAKKTTGKTGATSTGRKPAQGKGSQGKTRTTTTSRKPAARKAATKKQEFTDEQIAMKAYEIYQARMARGEHGHSDDDWHMAVKELRKEKK